MTIKLSIIMEQMKMIHLVYVHSEKRLRNVSKCLQNDCHSNEQNVSVTKVKCFLKGIEIKTIQSYSSSSSIELLLEYY